MARTMEGKDSSRKDVRTGWQSHLQGSSAMRSFVKTCAWTPMKSSDELHFLQPAKHPSVASLKSEKHSKSNLLETTLSEWRPYGFSPNVQAHPLTNTGMTPVQEVLSPGADIIQRMDLASIQWMDRKKAIMLNPVSGEDYVNRSASKFTSHLLTAKAQELGITPYSATPQIVDKFSPVKTKGSKKACKLIQEERPEDVFVVTEQNDDITYTYEHLLLTAFPWQINQEESFTALVPIEEKQNFNIHEMSQNSLAKCDEGSKVALPTIEGGIQEESSSSNEQTEITKSPSNGESTGHVDAVVAKMKYGTNSTDTESERSKPIPEVPVLKPVLVDMKLMAHIQSVSEKYEKESKQKKKKTELCTLAVSKENENKINKSEVKKTKLYCGCKKSSCLRLYCACFAASKTCNLSQCGCKNCKNMDELHQDRQKAIKQTLARDPTAFSTQRLTKSERKAALLKSSNAKPCNCKNSKCLKKYCECFFMSEFCSSKCKCKNCENYEGSLNLEKKGEKLVKQIQKESVEHN